MNIGIIDADLLDHGSRFPNLALMKISAYHKEQGHNVTLLTSYDDIPNYEKVFISKVFDFTKTPNLNVYDNVEIGGSGFFGSHAPKLPYEIEHHMPDYTLYDDFIELEIQRGIKPNKYKEYKNGSIGFITRGCIRQCDFCINKSTTRAVKHSEVEEFLDPNRKFIYLWDDNFLAYPNWEEELEKLNATGKPFIFRQGLDLRLITERKAKRLNQSNYYGAWTFAFDDIKDRDIIEKKLSIWSKYCKKTTRLYVLVAFKSQDEHDIKDAFERIKILMKHGCLPYIMRYDDWKKSKYRGMYINLARWCNQVNFYKKQSFREFCTLTSKVGDSTWRYFPEFEKEFPQIAAEYFDLKFEDLKKGKLKNEYLHEVTEDSTRVESA